MNTGIVHIENGFTLSSLTAFKALADTIYFDVGIPIEPENEYLEIVDIPAYNSGDPSHLLITEGNGNWTSANLNSTTYKHFYVEPGDYSSSVMTLTADGTENDRRSMSLYNGNDIHPASLLDAEQANIQIRLNGASYWDIDRMSCINPPSVDRYWIINGSSYNTMNKFHLKEYYYGINITHGCNYNTIQKSYINNMTHAGRVSDNVGIAITTGDYGAGTTVIGTKIIENDIRNANDGFQLVVSSSVGSSTVNYEGTIVDGNKIWMDGDAYTDGTYGEEWLDSPADTVPNPNFELYSTDVGFDNSNGSNYMVAENAIDLKSGSLNANNPVIVSNNMFWGFISSDYTAYGSQSGGVGSSTVFHYGVHNVIFTKNIVLECGIMGGVTNSGDGTYSSQGVEFSHNIAYKMLHNNPENITGDSSYMWVMNEINDWDMHHNTVVDCLGDRYFNFSSSTNGALVDNNLLIDCGTTNAYNVLGASDNYLYGTTTMYFLDQSGTVTDTTSSNANMGDYDFQYERYTTSPKTKTLTGVVSTATSPHYGIAGSNIV